MNKTQANLHFFLPRFHQPDGKLLQMGENGVDYCCFSDAQNGNHNLNVFW